MKTFRLFRFVCIFLITFSMAHVTRAGQDTNREELALLEQSANTVIDKGLRKALSEMVRLVALHDQSKSSTTRGEEVQDIYRASWRVYANFMGVREEYPDREVANVREIIVQIYEVTLRKTLWITEQKTVSRELTLAQADMRGKLQFFKEAK